MKKYIKKNSLPLHSNNLALHWIFCGQTALSLWPYDCNAHIICIGYLTVGGGCYKKWKKRIICIAWGLNQGGICSKPSQRYPIGTGSCLHEVL
jgi:hypothetical protein